MSRWLVGVATFLLCLGATAGAAPVDCGPAPSVKCLASEVFSLAKTLPADGFLRQHVAFAEQQLAPGDLPTALEYVTSDAPDAPPWEDIDWIAKAGRFDAAIKQARQMKSVAGRLGGLLAVAGRLSDRNEAARAQKLVEEIERQLPSISADDEYAGPLSRDTGALWVRLGRSERAVHLMTGGGIDSVSALLDVASKSSAAASLREAAWREAERANEPYAWQLVLEDAIKRGDQADILRVGKRASDAVRPDNVDALISLARVLLTAGLPDLSARLIKPWPQWINGKDLTRRSQIVTALMPVLAGLGQDHDVLVAASANDVYDRSRCLSSAIDEYIRLGRTDIAERLDAEALALASTPPTGDAKAQWAHHAALNNLALARAGHGDIQGAFAVVAKLRDDAKQRQLMSYVVRRAIESDNTPVVGPAIEALQQLALAAEDAESMLQAANYWDAVGSENNARSSLSQAMKMVDARHAPLTGENSSLAARLTWRLNAGGKPEALIDIVDGTGVNDAIAIDNLVDVVKAVSPAVAVQLTERQTEVERRIDELARIAVQVAANTK
jgi:hypothetical protein